MENIEDRIERIEKDIEEIKSLIGMMMLERTNPIEYAKLGTTISNEWTKWL